MAIVFFKGKNGEWIELGEGAVDTIKIEPSITIQDTDKFNQAARSLLDFTITIALPEEAHEPLGFVDQLIWGPLLN